MKKYLIVFFLAIFTFNLIQVSFAYENSSIVETKKIGSIIQIGEKLNYTIKWNGLTAAKMSLETNQVTKDKKALYKLDLKLATVGLARDLFQMNNNYTAFVDTKTHLPEIVERNLLQGTKSDQSTLVYNQEKHTVTIANEKPLAILPNTHDLSSILWAIRSASLKPEGEKITIFNSTDKRTFFAQIELGKKEETTLAKASSFARELIVKLEDKEKIISDKYAIRVWVTDDERRIPILITAQPSFGKIKIELLNSESEEENYEK
ncbi:MAG: DUF3108 domain-containing protein [Acidobacteria bacterium]|nr:DUF3108 domain-containing protein [Acidobacteriota bacterium]